MSIFNKMTDEEKIAWLTEHAEEFWSYEQDSHINGKEHDLLVDIVQQMDINDLKFDVLRAKERLVALETPPAPESSRALQLALSALNMSKLVETKLGRLQEHLDSIPAPKEVQAPKIHPMYAYSIMLSLIISSLAVIMALLK